MKKVLLIAALAVSTVATQAQTTGEGFSKGSLMLTGNVGFSTTKTPYGDEDITANSISFSPSIGYFVSPNIAVGINFSYGSSKSEVDVYEEKMTELGVGAFGRYYFTPANKFSMFLNLGAGYLTQKMEETGEPDVKYNGFSAAFSPGVNYFISNRLALETSIGVLGFTSVKPDIDGVDTEATTNFNFNVGLNNITFGLVYKLK